MQAGKLSTGTLRVLFVGHTYISQVAQAKLAVLSELGVNVGLVAPKTWMPVRGLFKGQSITLERNYKSLTIYPAQVFRSGHIASYIYNPWVLLSSILRFRPDIVQVDQEVYSYAAAQTAISTWVLGKKTRCLRLGEPRSSTAFKSAHIPQNHADSCRCVNCRQFGGCTTHP